MIDRDSGEMVAATIRTVFTQPTAGLVRTQLDTVADMLGAQFPKVKAMLLEAKEDLTAFADFPPRWKKIQSTNPLERVNGDQAQDRRRPGLSQRRRAHPAGHRRALRDASQSRSQAA
nr:transposase [Streptomyces monashensis]